MIVMVIDYWFLFLFQRISPESDLRVGGMLNPCLFL